MTAMQGVMQDVADRGLVLLGCGRMGSALLDGWLKAGLPPGSVWILDPEPSDWTITVEDPLPIAGGSPGLIGYSPADIYYDNVKVTVNQ